MSDPQHKVLCITLEPVALQMAGPAIRALELGRQLASEFPTTLFCPARSDLRQDTASGSRLNLVTGLSRQQLYALARQHDILFLQANVLKPYPGLAALQKHLVVDLYDPYLLAVLAQFEQEPAALSSSYRLMHKVLEKHMTLADFSICASDRQRDYWLGRFCSLGRLTPDLYKMDRSFRKLIDVVPFGVSCQPPKAQSPGARGIVPGIDRDSKLLIWGGGIWEWFDPLTVITAVADVASRHRQLRLLFMGVRSPNPQVPPPNMARQARQRAQELGILDKHVFFCPDWIPYEHRAAYLLEADVAVSAHFDLPETRFSFRTRILDYLWAGLPILTTGGDELSDMIAAHEAGVVLACQDVSAWARAIERMITNETFAGGCRRRSAALAAQFAWEKVAEPLKRYCRNPHRLPPYKKIRMPSLVERAQAVYARGGRELVLERSRNMLDELLNR